MFILAWILFHIYIVGSENKDEDREYPEGEEKKLQPRLEPSLDGKSR